MDSIVTDSELYPGKGLGRASVNANPGYHTQKDLYKPIKNGIWLYFFLLIFEGALRKWFLPGLATPLLIVRDPIALYIIIAAWQRKIIPSDPGLIWMTIIGFFSILTALCFGHGSLLVAAYGARILLLHFPLIFIIGSVFQRDDVVKIGIVILIIAIPMTFLIAAQFYSPQSAWVNRGLGGDMKGAGFSGALGYMRPPGTFSFTTGNSQFYSLVTCFVFYFLLNSKEINRILLIASAFCLLAAIPLTISRSVFFQVIVTSLFVVIASIRNSKYIMKVIFGGLLLFAALAVLSQYSFFQTATEAFTARFTNASASEGGVEGTFLDRYLGGMLTAIGNGFSGKLPFLGYGIGMGTNVASMFLQGRRGFFVSEEEWGRIIAELGPIMGLGVIAIRVSLTFKIIRAGYKRLNQGDSLTWLLLSVGAIALAQGGWAQPTSLGFSIIISGLMLASIRSVILKSNKVTPVRSNS
ncbi:MAG: hypothetical protein ABIN91_02265 [Mucilaginibacter sp.]|uniref:hypothetical protein n=1 Tax=Mucilaginibacter sp. TaxID=1882438 RepID=UPI003267C72F